MSDPIDFERLVTLYKKISFRNSSRIGDLCLNDVDDCDFLNTILEDQRRYGISLEEGSIEIHNEVVLDVKDPKSGLGGLFSDIKDVLSDPKNKYQELHSYFLIDHHFYNKDDVVPDCILHYRKILGFLKLIKEGEFVYFDERSIEFVFFMDKVFKVKIDYTHWHVENLDENSLYCLMDYFEDGLHGSQKLEILVESIRSIIDEMGGGFGCILENIGKVKCHFDKGYKLFVSGFSYEKIMNELRASKIEDMGKIHKVFSDIQNHILGIPVASIIVATQLKGSDSWKNNGIVNSAVLFGCFAFVTLVSIMLFNQIASLNAIKEEINHKKTEIEKEYSFMEEDVMGIFKSLGTRIRIQKFSFFAIIFFLITGLLSTISIYIYLTDPVRIFFVNSLSYFFK